MKYLVIISLLLAFLHADEIQRIESIVEEITKLRVDYEKCQNSLSAKKVLKTDIVKYKKDEDKSVKIIEKYKKLLKIKENELIALKKEFLAYKKMKTKVQKIAPKVVCKEPKNNNIFPKLMPKQNGKFGSSTKVQTFKASAFCLKIDSSIYSAPNAKRVDKWTKDTSFTSNKKVDGWIKITGYFVNSVWTKAKKDLWIQEINIFQK